MLDIPLSLQSAIQNGDCTLFLGAGIGYNLLAPNGEFAPDANKLATLLSEEFSVPVGDNTNLAQIAQIIEIRHGRKELETFVSDQLSNLDPDDNFKWLFTRRWRAIFTTNYDQSIVRAYDNLSNPPQKPIVMSKTSHIEATDPRVDVPVYYIHGSLFGSTASHIIITESDYARFRSNRDMMFEILKLQLATSTILYIGYSNLDYNWNTLVREIAEQFSPSDMPRAYRIAPKTDPIQEEILEKTHNIETINSTLSEFVAVAKAKLSPEDMDEQSFSTLRNSIPNDLKEAYDKNAAAVTRLLSSWEYVNDASFDEKPNIDEFLNGNRPNWGLIGFEQYFERDIENEIYDEHITDYYTEQDPGVRAKVILGSAGYGMTTVLMAISSRIVKDNLGKVFMLKPTQTQIKQGDIEFATNLFDERVYFVIDNASDYGEETRNIISYLKSIDAQGLFLLGDRLNEWRQTPKTPHGTELQLDALSDPEIHRLLDYLEKYSQLNTLANLPYDQRFSAIKRRHQKQLLVAMKESTEGQSFDAILESEYRGITNEIAQKAYLIVCCFFQYGVYIRAELLSRLLGLDIATMYQTINNPTEGVILYDSIDENRGIEGARARHRTIAEIVWQRNGSSAEKEQLLQAALSELNLNYGSDAKAFEMFVRKDQMVDDISTLDGRIRFFDKACSKDSESPYVRQHYARMLLRSNKHRLALSTIEEGIKLDANIRVLYHTKGKILHTMAINAPTVEAGLKFLAQSEDNYRQSINMYSRDDYGYQGLASLYLDWAIKQAVNETEQGEYLQRAEETIEVGLNKVRHRDGLWIVSANIQKWVGDQPSRIYSLEQAVKSNPNGIVAKYLLARAYRKNNQPEKTLETLNGVITENYNAYRSFVEYASAMLDLRKPYREIISLLEQTRTFGIRDARYVSILSGLYFINRDFTKYNKVIDEANKRNIPTGEKLKIQFYPPNYEANTDRLRIQGRVKVVKTGFSFIEIDGYDDVFCAGANYNSIIMTPNKKVEFTLGFNSKGSSVSELREV